MSYFFIRHVTHFQNWIFYDYVFFLKINNVHVSLQSWDIFIFLFYLPMSLYSISELPSNSSKLRIAISVFKRCHFSISQDRFTTMLVHILLVIRMTILTSSIHATPLWQPWVVSTHLMCTCFHRTGITNNIFVFCNLNFPLFLIYFAVYTYFKLFNIFFNSGVLLHMLIFMFGNVYFLSIIN